MKGNPFKLFAFPFILFCAFFFACTKPSCPNTKCENGGLKEGGGSHCSCICAYGYIGDSCQTEARQPFLGNYSAQCYDNNGFGCGVSTLQVIANADSLTGLSFIIHSDTLIGALDPQNSNAAIPSQVVHGINYVGSGAFQGQAVALTINSLAGSVSTTTYYQGPKQ